MTPEINLGRYSQGALEHEKLNIEIGPAIGSGFSGEVRRASFPDGGTVAVKTFRPPPDKEKVRDLLWAFSAGEPFPLEQDEKAVLYGLLCWQIFAEVANRKLSSALRIKVNPPLGCFYNEDKKAFGYISSFIDGTAGQPSVRVFSKEERSDDFGAKAKAMKALAELAEEIGMKDLSRQFQLLTLVSPENVLQEKTGQFVAVDVTPGLCIKMPLSPYDVKVFWDDVKRGEPGKKHFFGLEIARLEEYLTGNPELSDLTPLVGAIKELNYQPPGISEMAEKNNLYTKVWEARGLITEEEKTTLEENAAWPTFFILAKYFPLLELSRKGNRDLLRASLASYWCAKGSMPPEWAQAVARSDLQFLDYFFFEKPLRVGEKIFDKFLADPVRIMAGGGSVNKWLEKIGCQTEENPDLLCQFKAESDIRDIVSILALEPLFKVVSVGFLASVDIRLGILGALMETPFLPIPLPSPAGICRAMFLVGRSFFDLPAVAKTQENFLPKIRASAAYFLERSAWALFSSLKTIGNLALPIKLFATHPKEAVAIARYLIDGTVGKIPVFGDKSGVLQQMVFDLCFNLPYSMLERGREKFSRKTADND